MERFLETLVQEADPVLPHAREATSQAKAQHGASYPDGDVRKAVLHAWLAWQKEPGLPYGTAVRAGIFATTALWPSSSLPGFDAYSSAVEAGPNIVVNGGRRNGDQDRSSGGSCRILDPGSGHLQAPGGCKEICRVMEGG